MQHNLELEDHQFQGLLQEVDLEHQVELLVQGDIGTCSGYGRGRRDLGEDEWGTIQLGGSVLGVGVRGGDRVPF